MFSPMRFVFVLIFLSMPLHAEIVAEWRFDAPQDLSGGEVITLDQAAPGASTQSVLTGLSKYSAAETSLTDKWRGFLRKGFLDAGSSSATSDDEQGIVTKRVGESPDNLFKNYMGFAGLGKEGRGGTISLVFSPNSSWSNRGRRALFGTGIHPGQKSERAGWIRLACEENKTLTLTLGKGNGVERLTCLAAISLESTPLVPGQWYFLCATWQEGAEPVLYLREMNAEGPAQSPPAVLGTVSGAPLEQTTAPATTALAIGAFYNHHGDKGSTRNGSDARIAYACLENTPSTPEEIERKFLALGAP